MRLFVAAYPPAYALAHLAAAVDRLRMGVAAADGINVRLVARPLWHVTLAFLGEVGADRAPDAGAAVRAGVARWQAGGAGVPTLRLAGAGRFGRGRFTVLWVGLAGDVPALRALGDSMRRELRRARVPCDRKPMHAHLTLARPGGRLPPAEVAADLSELAGYEGPEWTLDVVQLVRSHLGPAPVYEPLVACPLT